jgi:translocator protein
MDRNRKAWGNAILLAATLAVNTLGALGVINGLTQKQISDRYVTLITPSPATFSIWGVIYSLLIISVIVMIVRQKDPYYQKALDEISVLFRISCVLNMAWIVAFSYEQLELSVLFIAGFVLTLALILRKLTIIREGRRWLLPLSFGLYTGWLFIATVVNIAAALVKGNWNRFGIADPVWAGIILVVALALVIGVLLKIRNSVFPLPVMWAYFGIYQFLVSPEGFKSEYGSLQVIALAGMAVLICAAALEFVRNRCSVLPGPLKDSHA